MMLPLLAGTQGLLLASSPPTHSGMMVDVFYPDLQPELRAAGMESCYRIPSLLFVPPPEATTQGEREVTAQGEQEATASQGGAGTLLAVVESKHGHVCGDGVNSTLVLRRSTSGGLTWEPPTFPFKRWESLRKWGQPQMAYDAVTKRALLLFSNETLSKSPGGVQSLGSVLQISSSDQGKTWSAPTRVDARDSSYPTGPAPTSGNGVQLRSGGPHGGRLLFSMDTSGYQGDQLLLSDDNGKTYQKSYALDKKPMDEIQLTQLGNGSVLGEFSNGRAQPSHSHCLTPAVATNSGHAQRRSQAALGAAAGCGSLGGRGSDVQPYTHAPGPRHAVRLRCFLDLTACHDRSLEKQH